MCSPSLQDAVEDPSWIPGNGAEQTGLGGAVSGAQWDYSVSCAELRKTCNDEMSVWQRSSREVLGLTILGEQPVFQAGM